MCSCCMCCCCDKNSDSASISSWVSGKFQKSSEEAEKEEEPPAVTTTDENTTTEKECSIATITQPTRQSCPPSPVTIATEQSRRGSLLSDSTFGDIPYIDVRLGLFEEDRFTDISEAIFKKHS